MFKVYVMYVIESKVYKPFPPKPEKISPEIFFVEFLNIACIFRHPQMVKSLPTLYVKVHLPMVTDLLHLFLKIFQFQ